MKKIKLVIISILMFLLSGCGNYKELNQLAIASAASIDKGENGYKVIVQVVNTQKESGGSDSGGEEPAFITYEAEGITLAQAFRNIVLVSPRKLYSSHLQLLVISEEIAKEGIFDVLDYFFRDPENRKQFIVVISSGSKAYETLEVMTPLERSGAKKIRDSLKIDSKYLGMTKPVTFEEMMSYYLSPNKEISLPGVQIIGNIEEGKSDENIKKAEADAYLSLTPLIVFKDDKMLGVLTKEESISLAYLKDTIKNTVVTHECEDGNYLTIELSDTKTDVSASKDKPKISVNIKSKGSMNENTCSINIEESEEIKKIKNSIGDQVRNMIEASIKSMNEKYNSDFYGFLDLFYKKNPKFYNTIKDKWYEGGLKDLEIEIKVDVELNLKGNALGVIKK